MAVEPPGEPAPPTEALQPDAPDEPEPFGAEADEPEPADDVEDATAVLWRQAVPDD